MTVPTDAVPLAAVQYERGFDIDALLLAACARLRGSGLRLGGLLQSASGDRGQCATSVHLVDLRTGQSFDIWEARGTCARGCRLDERNLAEAEAVLGAAIADRVDLLVVNRFGRAESSGRGLLATLTAALDAGMAVLTAVRPPYDEAWMQFHGGTAEALAADAEAIVRWACTASGRLRKTREAGALGAAI